LINESIGNIYDLEMTNTEPLSIHESSIPLAKQIFPTIVDDDLADINDTEPIDMQETACLLADQLLPNPTRKLNKPPFELRLIYNVPKLQNLRGGKKVQMSLDFIDFITDPHYCPLCSAPLSIMGAKVGNVQIDLVYHCFDCKSFFKTFDNTSNQSQIHFHTTKGRGSEPEAVRVVAACIMAGSTYEKYSCQTMLEGREVCKATFL
jgi:hypothetical protein